MSIIFADKVLMLRTKVLVHDEIDNEDEGENETFSYMKDGLVKIDPDNIMAVHNDDINVSGTVRECAVIRYITGEQIVLALSLDEFLIELGKLAKRVESLTEPPAEESIN